MRHSPTLPIVLLLAALLASCAGAALDPAQRQRLWGTAMPPDTHADETITVGPDTRYVNVEGGKVIRFVRGDQVFLWRFDGLGEYSFELEDVMPHGMLGHPVRAYVSQDPHYAGGR